MSTVTYEVGDGYALIRINRPEKLNALNRDVRAGLSSAFASAEADSGVRCVILTGVGKAFSVGADISEFASTTSQAAAQLRDDLEFLSSPERQKKPIIAAVNGYAFGGGFELALASDIIVACEGAQFSAPEPRLGVLPGLAMQRLPSLIGLQRARQVLLTARRITAHEAKEWGLVAEVVAPAVLMDAAIGLARQVAELAPLAVQLLKVTLNRTLNVHDLAYAQHVNASLFGTADAKEGALAFKEKRPPTFKAE